MRSHDVDYEVFGDDMQIVEIELDPAFHKRFGAGFFGGEGSILGSLGDSSTATAKRGAIQIA